ncbi:MAG TPA: hypothetical protein VEX62_11640 [Candidatus Limnocylindrales bacterium]|nr:hypothetical protein [Candidatus Limnocylindrales bacterium]
MPNLAPYHSLFVTAHVVGVIIFVIAHAVSAYVLIRMQSENDPDKLRSLLGWSSRSLGVAGIGMLIWFLAGFLAGFSGNWWTSGRLWIWAALAVAIAVTGIMTPLGRMYLNRVRESLGIDPKSGMQIAGAGYDAGALQAARASGRPWLLAAIGLSGLVILFWLMLAKPF